MGCNGSGFLDCYCQGDHCACKCPPACPGCRECKPEDLATERKLIDFYERVLPFPAVRLDGSESGDCLKISERMQHVRWMLAEMKSMNDPAKLNRWIGFLQGVLFTSGFCTIEELRQHVIEARNV